MSTKDKIVKRFFKWVNKYNSEDCWLWQGMCSTNSYGLFKIGQRNYGAHRVSYWLFNSNFNIHDKTLICHKCDNKLCVNPKHLFMGTNSDNTQDMLSKARESRGEKHPSSKLTKTNVLLILTSS